MKPDDELAFSAAAAAAALDLVERAHLRDPGDRSHVMYRYEPPAEFVGLLQRVWIPVWSVPPGQEATQRVLQYPVCLIVITPDYARFYGVVSGLSATTLTGTGWAVGLLLAPAAGFLLTGAPISAYTDRFVDATEVLGTASPHLVERVRASMAADPHSPTAHQAAITAYGQALRPYLPVNPEGELINRLVAHVEDNNEVLRVSQVCDAFDLSERALVCVAGDGTHKLFTT